MNENLDAELEEWLKDNAYDIIEQGKEAFLLHMKVCFKNSEERHEIGKGAFEKFKQSLIAFEWGDFFIGFSNDLLDPYKAYWVFVFNATYAINGEIYKIEYVLSDDDSYTTNGVFGIL